MRGNLIVYNSHLSCMSFGVILIEGHSVKNITSGVCTHPSKNAAYNLGHTTIKLEAGARLLRQLNVTFPP